MIQINLVPDIKAEFLKAEKVKTMVITISVLVSVGLLLLTAIMYSYANFSQKTHLENLQKDIDSTVNELRSDETAIKAVTVNNQLKTLPGLHSERPAAHRLPGFLSKVVPSTVQLGTILVNFDEERITVEGLASGSSNFDSAKNANIFIDTIKNAEYTVLTDGQRSDPVKAFQDVVVDSIATETDDGILTSFSVSFSYVPDLFDKEFQVELSVPETSSDQTTFDRSDNLFEASNSEDE